MNEYTNQRTLLGFLKQIVGAESNWGPWNQKDECKTTWPWASFGTKTTLCSGWSFLSTKTWPPMKSLPTCRPTDRVRHRRSHRRRRRHWIHRQLKIWSQLEASFQSWGVKRSFVDKTSEEVEKKNHWKLFWVALSEKKQRVSSFYFGRLLNFKWTFFHF